MPCTSILTENWAAAQYNWNIVVEFEARRFEDEVAERQVDGTGISIFEEAMDACASGLDPDDWLDSSSLY
ncbi:Fc.00g110500.m01.CDS01 [Cosmosporella sp. VM-42]